MESGSGGRRRMPVAKPLREPLSKFFFRQAGQVAPQKKGIIRDLAESKQGQRSFIAFGLRLHFSFGQDQPAVAAFKHIQTEMMVLHPARIPFFRDRVGRQGAEEVVLRFGQIQIRDGRFVGGLGLSAILLSQFEDDFGPCDRFQMA